VLKVIRKFIQKAKILTINRDSTMTKIQQNFNGTVYGVVGNVEGNMIINATQSQNLAEAAAEIQELLAQLTTAYPDQNKIAIANKAVEAIEHNPKQKSKILKVIQAGGAAALMEITNNPILKILIPMLEALIE
jgi:hypothetical protein